MRTHKSEKNKGISLIELVVVIAIMAILVGVLVPVLSRYIEKSRKAKDLYTADEIARAVNVAFIENSDAYERFMNYKGKTVDVDVTVNGVKWMYKVYLIAASGKQDTNKVSNCFNGGEPYFYKTKKNGSDGFYGVINRELGLSTDKMNDAIIPQHKVNGRSIKDNQLYADRWRICRRADNGMLEIWVAQPNPWGGYPAYRLWPEPDDEYTK